LLLCTKVPRGSVEVRLVQNYKLKRERGRYWRRSGY
jgi:hypothetical protein